MPKDSMRSTVDSVTESANRGAITFFARKSGEKEALLLYRLEGWEPWPGRAIAVEEGDHEVEFEIKVLETRAEDQGTGGLAVVGLQPMCNGVVLRTGAEVDVGNDYMAWVGAEPPHLEQRVHPDGKRCGSCSRWDRSRGQALLREATYKFDDGTERNLYQSVMEAVCDQQGLRSINADNVGYCPLLKEINSKESPACVEGFRED
jgi:hypothetical protein